MTASIAEIVAAQRRKQGLPPTVSEPQALRALARLLSPLSTPPSAVRTAEPSPDAPVVEGAVR
jgi:hypothetical protein